MKELSRRSFVGSLFSLAVASLSSNFPYLNVACRKPSEAVPQIDPDFEPGYLRLHRSGKLRRRGEELWQLMKLLTLPEGMRCRAARWAGGYMQGYLPTGCRLI